MLKYFISQTRNINEIQMQLHNLIALFISIIKFVNCIEFRRIGTIQSGNYAID